MTGLTHNRLPQCSLCPTPPRRSSLPAMEATELIKKIQELEQGQAQIKRDISKIVPSVPQFAIHLRTHLAGTTCNSPGTIGAVAACGLLWPETLRQDPALSREGRVCFCPPWDAHVLVSLLEFLACVCSSSA
ncbi:hypothetical protein ABZP36_020692 [Zizania latifolia]